MTMTMTLMYLKPEMNEWGTDGRW